MNVRAPIAVALFLLLGAACALKAPIRYGGGLERPTSYSPGDGLVIVPVESSTTAVKLDGFSFRVRHVELDYEIQYHTRDKTFLLEPGRYRITSARVGKHIGGVTSDVFTVKSGAVTVLPTLRIFSEEGHVKARFDQILSVAAGDFEQLFHGTPWRGRPWLASNWQVEPIASAFVIPLPPSVRRQPWKSGGHSGSSWSPTHSPSPPNTSRSEPSSTRTPR